MEEKKMQLLLIDPQNELKFLGPFNTHVTSRMRLTNPTDKIILFKIKTTAPKKYCVRPNCGTLDPQESTDVSIVLQPFIFDPTEKNRHKFMVQSVIAPVGFNQYSSIEQVWKEISPSDLMDSKLRCVFEIPVQELFPGGSTVTSSGDEGSTAFAATLEASSLFKGHGASGDDSATVTASDTSKVASELRQLREEESQLRHENMMLKEQILRLKIAIENDAEKNSAQAGGSNVWSQASTLTYQPQNTYASTNLSVPKLLGISVVIGILCILFGKYVL